MMQRMRRQSVFAALAIFLAARVVNAQATKGSITGVVKDNSGAVVPSATVKVVSESTGILESIESQHDGVYISPPLTAGTYRVAVSAPGFKQIEVTGLKVDVATALTQDFTLEVGLVTETVKVEGQTSLVETTSGN